MPTVKDTMQILLENLTTGQKFYKPHDPSVDQTLGYSGEVCYAVLGTADNVEEAQILLYGTTY